MSQLKFPVKRKSVHPQVSQDCILLGLDLAWCVEKTQHAADFKSAIQAQRGEAATKGARTAMSASRPQFPQKAEQQLRPTEAVSKMRLILVQPKHDQCAIL